jgi:predicted hydrocarbon binding protein
MRGLRLLTSQSVQAFYYPNLMGRSLIASLQEILGDKGLLAVLSMAKLPHLIESRPPKDMQRQFSFASVSRVQSALEKVYGEQYGQGLGVRCGRVIFNHVLRDFGPQVGLTDLDFRLLPMGKKISASLDMLADTFNRFTDQRVRFIERDNLFWEIQRCPLCWQRITSAPSCALAIGFLQEAMYWVSSGRHYRVEETECIAAGSLVCVIQIDKHPIE